MSTKENGNVSEDVLCKLGEDLREMPENMRIFSLCFRALYTDQAVSGQSEAAVKFRKIRDDTRQDAMVYVKCILPLTTTSITSVKDYFETYEALTYEEWREMLPDILKETKEHKELTQTLLNMYENIMTPLKKRQDEATKVMDEFVGLQSQFEEMCKTNEATANKQRKWANALLFVPVVNTIARPLLEKSACDNNELAVANKTSSDINKAAALAVATALIPALSNFIDGLSKMAGFFKMLEEELKGFEEKAEKDEHKMLHYKKMYNSAKGIKSHCQAFYAVLPAVRTDFEALPVQDTDQNYVDKWLEKTLAEIRSQSVLKALSQTVPGSKELIARKLKQPPPILGPKPAARYATTEIKLPEMETLPKLPQKIPPKIAPKPKRKPPSFTNK